MATIWQDVRFAVRLLLKQPSFASVAILTMALGMGVSTALFSVIDATVVRTLPYPDPSQLVDIIVQETQPDRNEPLKIAPSMRDLRDWRDLGSVFSHVGAGRVAGFRQPIVDAGTPERLTVATMSEDFLETYGIAPVLGRSLNADDTREGATPVALLGHAYWQSRFAGDTKVLGRIVRLDDVPTTIVGVLPEGFYPQTSLWGAEQLPPARVAMRGSGTPVIGRLKPGVTLVQAAQILDQHTTPGVKTTATRVLLRSLYDNETSGYWSTLQTLGAAVGVILLIACVNVAGLLLARGFTRQPELAIRTSLGASRGRLVRQMLTESVILAVAGTAVGLVLAWVTLDSLISLMPFSLPANSPATINLPVLGATLAVCVGTAVLFGFVPAMLLSRRGSIAGAAAMNRTAGAQLTPRLGQFLVASEVALALILLAGAGLLVRSFVKLVSVDLGYDPSGIVTMEIEPLEKSAAVHRQYYPALTQALAALPEVGAVGAIDRGSLTGGGMFLFAQADTGASMEGPSRTVLPGYFESLGVRPVMGRLFSEGDRSRGDVAIINASAAARYFPGGALGHTFHSGRPARTVQIVGVVPDLRHSGPLRRVEPQTYVLPDPQQTTAPFALAMVLRAREGMFITGDRLVATANAIGPRVLVGAIRPAGDILNTQVSRPKRQMLLLALLGGFGLILTVVGIFGVTVYAVARRTREIGIRVALGASRRRVVGTVVRDAAWPILLGLVVGLAGAQATTRVVATFLFQTTPHDPLTFAAVVGLVLIAAGAAAWVPARRAAAIEPITALRAE